MRTPAPRSLLALGAALVLFPLGWCPWPGSDSDDPDPQDLTVVSFTSEDGVALEADLYPVPDARPRIALVLVHMLGRDRSTWGDFATRARAAGVPSLAVDLRGHGASVYQEGRRIGYQDFQTAGPNNEWNQAERDVAAAAAEMRRRYGETPIALVGASIGANLVLNHAARDPGVAAAVLLSPGLSYHDVSIDLSIVRALGRRPVLVYAAEGDRFSAQGAAQLDQWGRGAGGRLTVRILAGGLHGTNLLNPTLNEEILAWLLGVSG